MIASSEPTINQMPNLVGELRKEPQIRTKRRIRFRINLPLGSLHRLPTFLCIIYLEFTPRIYACSIS